MTQIDLSQLSQLSKSYVSFLETGVRHPSREVVLRVAEVLDPEALLGLKDELLILAGFTPEDPAELRQKPLKSTPGRKDFHSFLQYSLQLIRQGAYDLARQTIEQGFQRFHKPAQMQTLLAHLELAQSRFEQAILLQQTALQHAQLAPQEQEPGLSEIDLILNLGVMFFLWGDQALFAAEPQLDLASQRYLKALHEFEKGLRKAPAHLYLLDEAGRVHFNLADLSAAESAQEHWRSAIACFRAVLAHPDKQQLSLEILRESAAFLALAFCKVESFVAAGLLLDSLSLVPEPDWLLRYVQACYHSLYHRQDPEGGHLQRALACLRQAIALNPAARAQARQDQHKDLAVLAEVCSQEFEEVAQCE